MTSKRKGTKKKNPLVAVVGRKETASGKHEVAWSPSGDLNAAHRYGNVKRFTRKTDALKFAKDKIKKMGGKTELWIDEDSF